MATAGDWIRARRKMLGLKREQLISPTGLSLSTLARAEKNEGPSNKATVVSIGKALRLEHDAADALADWHSGSIGQADFLRRYNGYVGPRVETVIGPVPNPPPITIPGVPEMQFVAVDPKDGVPVLGEVTAGGMVESMVFDGGEEPARVPLFYPGKSRVYALRVRGDSMSPEYRPGEYLICEDVAPEFLSDGEDAVVQCDGGRDGESTFKRCVFVGDGKVRLLPLNPAYQSIECRLDSIIRVGKVLGVYRPR